MNSSCTQLFILRATCFRLQSSFSVIQIDINSSENKVTSLVPNQQSFSADSRSEMSFIRRSFGVFLCTLVSASIATEGLFNAKGCGPNYYGDIISRPMIGRLMEFPWLARLGYRKSDDSIEYLFQGALIHPYYVVTSVFAAEYYQNSL